MFTVTITEAIPRRLSLRLSNSQVSVRSDQSVGDLVIDTESEKPAFSAGVISKNKKKN